MTTVGASCEIHLMLRGLVDVPREVARLESKMESLNGTIAKWREAMTLDNYEQKVSFHVSADQAFFAVIMIMPRLWSVIFPEVARGILNDCKSK